MKRSRYSERQIIGTLKRHYPHCPAPHRHVDEKLDDAGLSGREQPAPQGIKPFESVRALISVSPPISERAARHVPTIVSGARKSPRNWVVTIPRSRQQGRAG